MIKYLILVLLVFQSCSFPLFVSQNNNTGVNFTEGKWVLNQVDAPSNVDDKLIKMFVKDFNKFTKNNAVYYTATNKFLLENNNRSNFSTEVLKSIKKSTNYDFFVNLSASIVNDNEFVDSKNQKFGVKKAVVVLLEIYDLNNLQEIYKQELKGTIKQSENLNEKAIASSAKFLILHGYNKIIKDINRKSIK